MDALTDSPNLNFLRAIAVLFVTGFHLQLLFEQRHSPYVTKLGLLHSIGHWGVLIFFVHTSLVLMFSLERQHLRFAEGPTYLPFLTRRAFRVLPLSIFIVLLVTALRLPVGQIVAGRLESVHLHWPGILENFLLVQNLSHTDSVIVPLWSLPYEMQMYLFLPFLFLLVWRVRSVWPILLLWIMTVLIDLHHGGLERYGVPDFIIYIPCFLSGVLAYQLTKVRAMKLPALLWPPTLVILTYAYLKRPDIENAWLCCILLGFLIPQFREISNRLICGASKLVARYSYGIYLTHFICIWLAFQAFTNIPAWSRWVIFGITGTAFPVALYHLLERPMMSVGQKVANALRERFEHRVRVAV